MGKKKSTGSSLGRSIIRDRFGHKGRNIQDSHLHTSELHDGYDWNRINLRSVTEETSLDEFIATAELAGTEFTAERLNIKFVGQEFASGLLSAEDEQQIISAQDENRKFIKIPRRPVWTESTTSEELDIMERNSFLEWRRGLAKLQDIEGIMMTPFEKNLDFWRQLWRVIERSDIVAQIVDCRNPLLFRSTDLEEYVIEMLASKVNMVLLNKADYLTQHQREEWAKYFDKAGMRVAFWSATDETERFKLSQAEEQQSAETDLQELEEEDSDSDEDSYETLSDASIDEEKDNDTEKEITEVVDHSNSENLSDVSTTTEECCGVNSDPSQIEIDSCEHVESAKDTVCQSCENTCDQNDDVGCAGKLSELSLSPVDVSTDAQQQTKENVPGISQIPEDLTDTTESAQSTSPSETPSDSISGLKNNSKLLTGIELLEFFKSIHTGTKYTPNVTTVGLVGYPNVGKSSTINALLQMKKVPVSATPGRTKHFQTLFVEPSLMLCDCPGLVMPTFVNTKADMVLNGILPIDQMRDYVQPVALMNKRIPRQVLEAIYGIMVPKPREGEDEDRPPTAHELLGAYGYMRGYMTHKGIPDFQRSARHVLKDYVNGKLLYCTPPPGVSEEEFCSVPVPLKPVKDRQHPQQKPIGSKTKGPVYVSEVDRSFFEKKHPRAGTKGIQGGLGYIRKQGYSGNLVSDASLAETSPASSSQSLAGKPWKKHHNRGKKEKLRRVTSYLDA